MASWISSRLLLNSYSVALCMSQRDFDLHLRMSGLPRCGPYLLQGAIATGHQFDSSEVGPVYIVCINPEVLMTPIESACALVHEAVHIWQAHCLWIGETAPGNEIEAYAIESLSKHLMDAYAVKINLKKRR